MVAEDEIDLALASFTRLMDRNSKLNEENYRLRFELMVLVGLAEKPHESQCRCRRCETVQRVRKILTDGEVEPVYPRYGVMRWALEKISKGLVKDAEEAADEALRDGGGISRRE